MKKYFRICALVLAVIQLSFVFGQETALDTVFVKGTSVPIEMHIGTIRKTFENYIQYQESTDSQENKDEMTNSLKAIDRLSNANDLELLINVWMYYDPTDYPDISEIYRILKASLPQSIEAVQQRLKNKKEWERNDIAPYSDLKLLLVRLENELD